MSSYITTGKKNMQAVESEKLSFPRLMSINEKMNIHEKDNDTISNVTLTPSCQNIIDKIDEENECRQFKLQCEDYFFSKRGHRHEKPGTKVPLRMCFPKFENLVAKAKALQPRAKEKRKILAKRGRELVMEKYCKGQSKQFPVGTKLLHGREEEEVNARKLLSLEFAKVQHMEEYPEIAQFNRDAAACQVQATLACQLEQKKALANLPCLEKDTNYTADLSATSPEYIKEAKEREEEKLRRQNILDIVKKQCLEHELIGKIGWEDLQGHARRIKAACFESSTDGMQDLKAITEAHKQFRTDMKNIINYNLELIRLNAQEARLRMNREEDFLKQKALFNEKCNAKELAIANARKEKYERLFDRNQTLMKQMEERGKLYEEWVVYNKEKELFKREADEKLRQKAARVELLKQRQYLLDYAAKQKQFEKEESMKEYLKNQAWINFEDRQKAALALKNEVLADKNKFIILQQNNDFEKRKLQDKANKFTEGANNKKYESAYNKVIKKRLQEKLEQYRKFGLPKVYISQLKRQYKL